MHDVKNQYENYPFPLCDPEDEKYRITVNKGNALDTLDRVNHYCFQGKRNLDGFRVLVAGGGTGNATIYLAEQLRGKGEVVYIDFSEASMRVAQQRASIRGIENIRWINGSLLDIPDFGVGPFDYISCVGVLHHLEDPVRGLHALTAVLNDSGSMALMLYGKYGRAGVYQMQVLMRLINEDETDMDKRVRNTRAVFEELPDTNWLHKGNKDLLDHYRNFDDINIYDTFLHSQDRAYSVPEVYAFAEASGLQFVEFVSNTKFMYRPELYIRNSELLDKVLSFDAERQSAICELIGGHMGSHFFYVSRHMNTIADPRDTEMVPFFFPKPIDGLSEIAEAEAGNVVNLGSGPGNTISFRPSEFSWIIFKYLDGRRTIDELLNRAAAELTEAGISISRSDLFDDFLRLYNLFNNVDLLLLRGLSVEPSKTLEEMQAPVSALYNNPQKD